MDLDDASLVTGMLAPSRLRQLTQFVGLAGPPQKQVDEPSFTTSSLHGLSLDDKVATLSALQPSAAAAILGALYCTSSSSIKANSAVTAQDELLFVANAKVCLQLSMCSLSICSLQFSSQYMCFLQSWYSIASHCLLPSAACISAVNMHAVLLGCLVFRTYLADNASQHYRE